LKQTEYNQPNQENAAQQGALPPNTPKNFIPSFLRQRQLAPEITIAEIGARITPDKTGNRPEGIFRTLPEARVITFEPDSDACKEIIQFTEHSPADIQTYPYAVGGVCGSQTLYETNAGDCSSLYKPNEALLQRYRDLEVVYLKNTREIDVITLNAFMEQEDVKEIDFIKVDVQGAELDVFKGAGKAMPQLIGVCTEVEWVPIYEGQPLFGDVDAFLRQYGLQLHHFIYSSDGLIRNTAFEGKKQVLWSDAIYFPKLEVVDTLPEDKLLKLAMMAGMYDAHDLAQYALKRYDMLHASALAPSYVAEFAKHFLNINKEDKQEAGFDILISKLPGDISIALPNNLNLMTPYILQEQQDWFEDEIKFVRHLVQPGMHIIDIGANYGCYTLTMARLIGETGNLWAFEPASATAGFLKKSLELNDFHNVELLQCALSDHAGEAHLTLEGNAELNALVEDNAPGKDTETVPLKRLDDCMIEFGWDNIDFIKLDAEGEEVHILDGGRDFLEQCSPLIMFEIKDRDQINDELIRHFIDFGYNPYVLVPGLSLLAPFDLQKKPDDFQLNLFCCKDDRARILEQAGMLTRDIKDAELILPEGNHWQTHLKELPYAQSLLPVWNLHLENSTPLAGGLTYLDALHAYALAHCSKSAKERLYYLQNAHLAMKAALDKKTTIPRLFSLARIITELGRRCEVLKILNDIASHFEKNLPFIPNEPFLAVSTYAERTNPEEHLNQWCLAQVLAQRERLQAFSSYFSGNRSLPVLERIRQLGFEDEDMHRRYLLIQQRFAHAG